MSLTINDKPFTFERLIMVVACFVINAVIGWMLLAYAGAPTWGCVIGVLWFTKEKVFSYHG